MIRKLLEFCLKNVEKKETNLKSEHPMTPSVILVERAGIYFTTISNNQKFKCECDTLSGTPCRKYAKYMLAGKDYCERHAEVKALGMLTK